MECRRTAAYGKDLRHGVGPTGGRSAIFMCAGQGSVAAVWLEERTSTLYLSPPHPFENTFQNHFLLFLINLLAYQRQHYPLPKGAGVPQKQRYCRGIYLRFLSSDPKYLPSFRSYLCIYFPFILLYLAWDHSTRSWPSSLADMCSIVIASKIRCGLKQSARNASLRLM